MVSGRNSKAIRETVSEMRILFGLVQSILIDNINIQYISPTFIPRNLTHDQKENHLHIVCDMLEYAEFMRNIIIGDESWVYSYEVVIKTKSS